MLRHSALLFAVVGCLAIAGVTGCGSSSSSSSGAAVPASSTPAATTHFAKTKFVLHIGLAGWAFHHYIYKPFRAGEFAKPLSHKIALAKAALAALFTYRELKLAAVDVRSSKVLQVLFSPITLLAAKFASLRNDFVHGRYNAADINSAQTAGGSISAAAAAKGYPNGDIPGQI